MENLVLVDKEVSGVLKLCKISGTPFGAYPMFFPQPVGHKMAELLISDFTINSLAYHLHRIGFISFRLTPQTPMIGSILKTTCSTEEDGLEDHGVETEEGGISTTPLPIPDVTDITEATTTALKKQKRSRRAVFDGRFTRQSADQLADLGFCFGDLFPAIRENYPKQNIVVLISSSRAPSVILSSRNGGTATVDFGAYIDFLIESTNQKVGRLSLNTVIEFVIRTAGNRISAKAEFKQLNITEVGSNLGIGQEGLDNIVNLGKEVLAKALNDALEKGTTISIPPNVGGLPINILSPEVVVVEHGLHLAFDFTISPSGLALLGSSGSTGCSG